MLTLTPEAGQLLTDLLDKAEVPDGVAARFMRGAQGLQLGVDKPTEEDQTFQHAGKTVLVLEPELSDALADKSLVVTESEQGPALAITDDESPAQS
jgi:hypothetical protein